MTRDEFREWTLREPFIPFVIITNTGKKYRIPDYGYVMVRLYSIYIKTEGHPLDFDLPLKDIASCEPYKKRAKAPRRRRA